MNFVVNITYVLIVLAIVVIILSNLELYKNKKSSPFSIELPKSSAKIDTSVFDTINPIYIYNSVNVKKHELKLHPVYSDFVYLKYDVPIHIGAKLTQPIKDMWAAVKSLPFTKLPINTLYTGLNKSDTLLTNINPLISPEKGKYRMLVSKDDAGKVEAFIDNDRIYFVK